MKSVGVDIGSFSIKIVEIEVLSKGFDISRIQEFPLSQDPNRNRKIEIIDLLRNLFSGYDLSNTQFILALRQNHVSSRVRRFPFRERHKILKSLAIELEDDIPFSPEDSIFEAKITKYFGREAEVFALASPKERIVDLLSLASDCGIDPDIVSVEGVALNNLIEPFLYLPREQTDIEAPLPEPKPAQILLNIGHEHTVLLALEEGTMKLLRHIDFGGRHLAEGISKHFNMHYLEAIKDLQRKSVLLLNNDGATKDQIALSDTLKNSFEPLIQELRLSILEIKSDFQLEFKEILITGGVAQLKNLTAFLTQKLEISTNTMPPIVVFPNLNFEQNSFGEVSASLALGLAIEGLRRPKNPAVQFLKNEFIKHSQSFQMRWEKWNYTGKILIAAFFFLLIYSYAKDDLSSSAMDEAQTRLKTQAAAIADLKGPKATLKAINEFIKAKDQDEKSRALSERVQDVIQGLDLINRLSISAPSRKNLNIQVLRIHLQGEYLDLQGDVGSQKEFELFKNNLANLSNTGTVEVLPIKSTAGRVSFSFRVRVSRTRGG